MRDLNYVYNSRGKLRERSNWDGTDIQYPRYDGDDIIVEHTPANGYVPVRRFVHGPGVDEPLVQYDKQADGSWTRQWLMADVAGSVIATGNGGGGPYWIYSYGPYGEPNTAFLGSRLRYTGQWYDPDTGLYYYKARWYSPWLGRFLQPDPAGDEDGPNLYAYTGNDPVNMSDPTGMFGEAAGGFANFGLSNSGFIGSAGRSGLLGSGSGGQGNGFGGGFGGGGGSGFGGGLGFDAYNPPPIKLSAPDFNPLEVVPIARGAMAVRAAAQAGRIGEIAAGVTGPKQAIRWAGRKLFPDRVTEAT